MEVRNWSVRWARPLHTSRWRPGPGCGCESLEVSSVRRDRLWSATPGCTSDPSLRGDTERDVLTFTAYTCLTLDLILILNSSFSSKQPTRDDTLKLNLYLHSCQHPEGSGTRCGRSPGVSLWGPAHTSWPARPGWIHGGKLGHAAAPPADEPPPDQQHTKTRSFLTQERSSSHGQSTKVFNNSLITLYLLHVLGDGVLLQELCALTGVETLCVSEELTLEVLFVHGQRRAFGEGVLLVQTELDCRGENRWDTRAGELTPSVCQHLSVSNRLVLIRSPHWGTNKDLHFKPD